MGSNKCAVSICFYSSELVNDYWNIQSNSISSVMKITKTLDLLHYNVKTVFFLMFRNISNISKGNWRWGENISKPADPPTWSPLLLCSGCGRSWCPYSSHHIFLNSQYHIIIVMASAVLPSWFIWKEFMATLHPSPCPRTVQSNGIYTHSSCV